MENVPLCICGCGEPALYAVSHIPLNHRNGIDPSEWSIEDHGYPTASWIFKKDRVNRYSNMIINGRRIQAHRWMYEQAIGPIPDGLVIDHLCKVTKCINPAHLEAVTSRANLRRGRLPKLNETQAREIRAAKGTLRARELAAKYGVTTNTISLIWTGKTWRND